MSNQKLLAILFQETESLKIQYVKLTIEWAEKHFNTCKARASWNEAQWCEFMGLTPRVANPGTPSEYFAFPSNFYNTKDARRFDSLKTEIRKVCTVGIERYKETQAAAAVQHYENSILKLAERIEKKQMNQDALTVETAHVGVNINTTLTDGQKTVRAFTIIASGEVQRPHYRYLVK